MEINEENYYVVLKAKHDRLFAALDRAQDLRRKYLKILMDMKKTRTKWEDVYDWDFNLVHDLEDRIRERIYQNYLVVGDWNYKVHGLNILDIGNAN